MLPADLLKKILDAIASGDEKAQAALLPEIVTALSGSGEPAAASAADPLAAGADPLPEEEVAAMAVLKKLTGKVSVGEAVAEYAAMSARIGKIEADAQVLEDSSRRELVGKLVKLGAELPATAWEPLADDADPKAPRTPVKRLRTEPIADLRARVEALSKAAPVKLSRVEAPESGDDAEPVVLSKSEQAYCDKHKITPAAFAARKGSVARSRK
jgi:hypothetical protein